MEDQSNATKFDPHTWDGDYDELQQWIELLAIDESLCERTFASHNEAFTAGLYLGERERLTPVSAAQ